MTKMFSIFTYVLNREDRIPANSNSVLSECSISFYDVIQYPSSHICRFITWTISITRKTYIWYSDKYLVDCHIFLYWRQPMAFIGGLRLRMDHFVDDDGKLPVGRTTHFITGRRVSSFDIQAGNGLSIHETLNDILMNFFLSRHTEMPKLYLTLHKLNVSRDYSWLSHFCLWNTQKKNICKILFRCQCWQCQKEADN